MIINSFTFGLPPDTESPSTPTNLSATVNGGYNRLQWTASTDNVAVTGYKIWRGTTSGSYSLIDTTSGTGTLYDDCNYTRNVTYYYVVEAFDAAGNVSAFSNESSVRNRNNPAPCI